MNYSSGLRGQHAEPHEELRELRAGRALSGSQSAAGHAVHKADAYALPSPNAKQLTGILKSICAESGMMSDPDECFAYMNELPERETQVSMFDPL